MVEPAMSKTGRRSIIDTIVPVRRQAGWLTTLYDGEAELAGPAHPFARRRWRNGLIAALVVVALVVLITVADLALYQAAFLSGWL